MEGKPYAGDPLKPRKPGFCRIVTCLPCRTGTDEEECFECGMLDWLEAFNTEEECNAAYKKQYPEEFDEKGRHVNEPN